VTGDHSAERPGDDDYAAERPGDDDYDLLTYGEAAARLTEEIRKERRRLAELEERARRGTEAGEDIAAVLRRINDLTRAAERQARQQREARDFARFFGTTPGPDDHRAG
jgi:hypothetical protein